MTTWFQYPVHFIQGLLLVGDIAQAKAMVMTSMLLSAKGSDSAFIVAFEAAIKTGINHAVVAHVQHGLVDVANDDCALRAQLGHHQFCNVSGAARQVQDRLAGSDATGGHKMPFHKR